MDDVPERLRQVPIEVVGQFTAASNATLLVRLLDRAPGPLPEPFELDAVDATDLAVYKPRRGEAPLWDFPPGTLHRREVAAHVVSELAGWDLVPTTVLRDDGPYGAGSLQRFVRHDPDRHYFVLLEEARPDLLAQLRTMVMFDLVIDNADRKGGHVLVEETAAGEHLRVVDHGVAFNAEPKLRTVAWDFQDEPVPAGLRADVARLRDEFDALAHGLHGLLADEELEVLEARLAALVELTHFPAPVGPRPFPWPLV